jgi:hypothetical protein
MGWTEKARKSMPGGKPMNTSAFGRFSGPTSKPVLASALSIALFACFFLLVATSLAQFVAAADPGHPASSVSAGTFETGDFAFPGNLTVTKFLIANGSTLYVDAVNGKVGIGTASPANTLSVLGTFNVTNTTGTLGLMQTANANVGIGTANPQNKLEVVGTINATAIKVGTTNVLTGESDPSSLHTSGGSNGMSQAIDMNSNNMQDIGSLYTDDSSTNFFSGGCSDNQYMSGISAAGAISCAANSGDIAGITTAVTSGISGGCTSGTCTLTLNSTCTSGQLLKSLGSGSWQCAADDAGVSAGWTTSGNYVYNNTAAAKVGIGTSAPNQKFEVVGIVNATNYMCGGGTDCINATQINSTSLASECADITGSAGLCDGADNTCSSQACTVGSDDTLTSPTVGGALNMANYAITNIGNANTDFSSDGGLTINGNLSTLGSSNLIGGNSSFDGGTLFVDSVNDRVGIGTTGPLTPVHVIKTVGDDWPTLGTASGSLLLAGTTNLWGMFAGLKDSTGGGWIQVMRKDSAIAYNLALQPVGGNVGIGTTTANERLNVSGNITISNTIKSSTGDVVIQLG